MAYDAARQAVSVQDVQWPQAEARATHDPPRAHTPKRRRSLLCAAPHPALCASRDADAREWRPPQTLVLTCLSNAALVLLRLGRAEAALARCEEALAMPAALGPTNVALQGKLLARKLQALLESAPARHEDALPVLDEARRKGYCSDAVHGWAQRLSRFGVLPHRAGPSSAKSPSCLSASRWGEPACTNDASLSIVSNAGAWYDGSVHRAGRADGDPSHRLA